MTNDREHLRLLAIFHYVVAALTLLFALFPLLHLAVGLGIVAGVIENDKDDILPFAGWFLVVVSSLWIVLGICWGLAIAYAGRSLLNRQNYHFCFFVALLTCLKFPYGTLLGVFTIVVLMRDSVKELFGRPVSAPGSLRGAS